MELTYKDLKIALDEVQVYQDRNYTFPDKQILIIEAAKLYLPILLHQEFIKPNEYGNTDK